MRCCEKNSSPTHGLAEPGCVFQTDRAADGGLDTWVISRHEPPLRIGFVRINKEIGSLRRQQELVLELLKDSQAGRRARVMDKASWVSLLRATGLNDRDMERWHSEFERLAPEAHQDFLEFLGIDGPEIDSIRQRARGM